MDVKALVHEIQVHVLVGMTHQGQYATARRICHKILEMYSDEYPIRRVRVIERLMYITVVDGNAASETLKLGSEAITKLTTTKVNTLR